MIRLNSNEQFIRIDRLAQIVKSMLISPEILQLLEPIIDSRMEERFDAMLNKAIFSKNKDVQHPVKGDMKLSIIDEGNEMTGANNRFGLIRKLNDNQKKKSLNSPGTNQIKHAASESRKHNMPTKFNEGVNHSLSPNMHKSRFNISLDKEKPSLLITTTRSEHSVDSKLSKNQVLKLSNLSNRSKKAIEVTSSPKS